MYGDNFDSNGMSLIISPLSSLKARDGEIVISTFYNIRGLYGMFL